MSDQGFSPGQQGTCISRSISFNQFGSAWPNTVDWPTAIHGIADIPCCTGLIDSWVVDASAGCSDADCRPWHADVAGSAWLIDAGIVNTRSRRTDPYARRAHGWSHDATLRYSDTLAVNDCMRIGGHKREPEQSEYGHFFHGSDSLVKVPVES